MATDASKAAESDPLVRAIALFSVLVEARHSDRFAEAAAAQSQLNRLGVFVGFSPPRKKREVKRAG